MTGEKEGLATTVHNPFQGLWQAAMGECPPAGARPGGEFRGALTALRLRDRDLYGVLVRAAAAQEQDWPEELARLTPVLADHPWLVTQDLIDDDGTPRATAHILAFDSIYP